MQYSYEKRVMLPFMFLWAKYILQKYIFFGWESLNIQTTGMFWTMNYIWVCLSATMYQYYRIYKISVETIVKKQK